MLIVDVIDFASISQAVSQILLAAESDIPKSDQYFRSCSQKVKEFCLTVLCR